MARPSRIARGSRKDRPKYLVVQYSWLGPIDSAQSISSVIGWAGRDIPNPRSNGKASLEVGWAGKIGRSPLTSGRVGLDGRLNNGSIYLFGSDNHDRERLIGPFTIYSLTTVTFPNHLGRVGPTNFPQKSWDLLTGTVPCFMWWHEGRTKHALRAFGNRTSVFHNYKTTGNRHTTDNHL